MQSDLLRKKRINHNVIHWLLAARTGALGDDLSGYACFGLIFAMGRRFIFEIANPIMSELLHAGRGQLPQPWQGWDRGESWGCNTRVASLRSATLNASRTRSAR